jgi:hypothetical protein
MLEFDFKYTNEYGTITHYTKQYTEDVGEALHSTFPGIQLIVEEFKSFLSAVGYTQESINEAFNEEDI